MKKIITLCVCALMAITSICAQDIIVTKDAKKIDAKILEVSTSEIRYKELDNLNGPIFILRVDEINSIIYANGKVVLYNQESEKIVSDEELLAIRQQAIADSIAEANRQAKKRAEEMLGGLNFGVVEENGVAETKTDQGGRGPAHKGEGSNGENKWSLKGRGLVGSLPKPTNTFNQAGKVVVQITVDAAGNVTEAVVVGGDISDKATIQLAVDAAKKAKFTSDKKSHQVGTITYTFKFD